MMGGDFGSRAAAFFILPLVVGAFVAGGLFFTAIFYGIPWIIKHVSITIN